MTTRNISISDSDSEKEKVVRKTPEGGEEEVFSIEQQNPLERHGKWFFGMKQDIVKRVKFYSSDFVDALNFRCLTTIVFMFFACFAPAITFGGLMGQFC